MNWKFWKKRPVSTNEQDLQLENDKLKLSSLLKDDLYLAKVIEFENFKKSAYATLTAIAVANGGEYVLSKNFSDIVAQEDFNGILSIRIDKDSDDMIIKVIEQEVKQEEV
jgi:hypothetical protein